MKKIPNLQTGLPPTKPGGTPATHADLLRACLDSNGQSGFTVELMRKRLRVTEAIAKVKAGGMIELEDADFETAKEAVKAMTWVINDPQIVKFAEAFGV